MICFEDAKTMGAVEIKEMVEEEYSNPTVQRMVFLETKDKEDRPGKIFPCYVEAYGKEEDKLAFQCCIVQGTGTGFGMVRVVIHEDELGFRKRIWDKPPKKAVREEEPWTDTNVVQ